MKRPRPISIREQLQALSREIGQLQTAANRAAERGAVEQASDLASQAVALRAYRARLLRGLGG